MHMTAEVTDCIDACQGCEEACLSTLRHCLEKGGRHAEARHVNTLLDCAALCATSSALMARGSDLSASVCELCAEACDSCAASCEAIADAEMKACAKTCRECARSCRSMAAPA